MARKLNRTLLPNPLAPLQSTIGGVVRAIFPNLLEAAIGSISDLVGKGLDAAASLLIGRDLDDEINFGSLPISDPFPATASPMADVMIELEIETSGIGNFLTTIEASLGATLGDLMDAATARLQEICDSDPERCGNKTAQEIESIIIGVNFGVRRPGT